MAADQAKNVNRPAGEVISQQPGGLERLKLVSGLIAVHVIESEISPRIFGRFNERLSDVRAAFALFGSALKLSITSHLCP
jgi:hypothetical protein